jgi:hypothetical protein
MQRPPPAFEPGSVRVSHQGLCPFNNLCSLSRVVPQRECEVPVIYGVEDGSGDLSKDAVF